MSTVCHFYHLKNRSDHVLNGRSFASCFTVYANKKKTFGAKQKVLNFLRVSLKPAQSPHYFFAFLQQPCVSTFKASKPKPQNLNLTKQNTPKRSRKDDQLERRGAAVNLPGALLPRHPLAGLHPGRPLRGHLLREHAARHLERPLRHALLGRLRGRHARGRQGRRRPQGDLHLRDPPVVPVPRQHHRLRQHPPGPGAPGRGRHPPDGLPPALGLPLGRSAQRPLHLRPGGRHGEVSADSRAAAAPPGEDRLHP